MLPSPTPAATRLIEFAAHVAGGEDPWNARLEQVRRALSGHGLVPMSCPVTM
jgi:hypothetical protein